MSHTVLLVDDEDRLLNGLVRALRGQPYTVYTAKSGEEAKWILKSRAIDVVVSDEKMPGLSGTELLAWVAENRPEVVRIVLTGHATVKTAIQAINRSAVHRFFTKPCNEFELAVVLHKALEEKDRRRREHELLQLATAPSLDATVTAPNGRKA